MLKRSAEQGEGVKGEGGEAICTQIKSQIFAFYD